MALTSTYHHGNQTTGLSAIGSWQDIRDACAELGEVIKQRTAPRQLPPSATPVAVVMDDLGDQPELPTRLRRDLEMEQSY